MIVLNWEKIRIQTYFIISMQLSRKNKISYKKFCRDIWPLIWDKKVISQELSEEEEQFNVDQWRNILNKPIISSRKIDENVNVIQ